MGINNPADCRLEAIRLYEMSNDAARRGKGPKARQYAERAQRLLLLAKEIEYDEAKEARIWAAGERLKEVQLQQHSVVIGSQ